MDTVSPPLRLKSLVGVGVRVDLIQVTTDKVVDKGFRMKQMKDGNLWLTDFNKIHVFKPDLGNGTVLKQVYSVSVPFKDYTSNPYIITTFTDSFSSPILALDQKIENRRAPCHIKYGLAQIDHKGNLDCIISGGPFSHVTNSRFDPRLISGIRGYKQVSFYSYDEENSGNKWIHVRDLFFEKEYSRHQLRRETMLLGGKDGTHIDEISLLDHNFGQVIRTIQNTTPVADGMYLCCLDDEETAVVADLPNNSLYVLEKNSEQLVRIKTNVPGPHDATLFNGKLLVLNNHEQLFWLEPQLYSRGAQCNLVDVASESADEQPSSADVHTGYDDENRDDKF